MGELRALPAVQEILTKNNEKLKKYHKRYGGKNMMDANKDELDVVEFSIALKDSRCIDTNLSYAKAVEIFIRCNRQEVSEYLSSMPNDKKIVDMSADFDEFTNMLIVCAES